MTNHQVTRQLLERALAETREHGQAQCLQTMCGHPVRIYALDGSGKYPVHGAHGSGRYLLGGWTEDGRKVIGDKSRCDLVPAEGNELAAAVRQLRDELHAAREVLRGIAAGRCCCSWMATGDVHERTYHCPACRARRVLGEESESTQITCACCGASVECRHSEGGEVDLSSLHGWLLTPRHLCPDCACWARRSDG